MNLQVLPMKYLPLKLDMASSKRGFTLLGMLLVLVIVSLLIIISMSYSQQKTEAVRIDKTVADIEQILNASLAFYIENGVWPKHLSCLQGINSNETGCKSVVPY